MKMFTSVICVRSIPLQVIIIIVIIYLLSSILLSLDVPAITSLKLNSKQRVSVFESRHTVNANYVIDTEGCRIPGLHAFDEDVRKLIRYPDDLKPCSNSNHPLLDCNRTHIWIVKDNFYHYNVSESSNLICYYKSFHEPATVEVIGPRKNDRLKYTESVNFNNTVEVRTDDEYVRVICKVGEEPLYDKFFIFAPKKKFRSYDDAKKIPKDKTTYNVIVMGMDSVSRLNFHRTMPKTLAYIKELEAVELLGYNKVGDNTFPNVIAMLLGMKETELKITCLRHRWSTFDNCPIVWKWYKKAGYYTAYYEDVINTTFSFMRAGFSESPTDYYGYPFMLEAEKHGSNRDTAYNRVLCLQERYLYEVLLDYIEQLTITLKSDRLFGFFWEVTMSHDYLNYPMSMDDNYVKFFKRLHNSKYLDNTIVFLLSDHGIRWGDMLRTERGRLEVRLPYAFVIVPQSFRKKYPLAYNNLQTNSNRLTTPFDIHATLSDLADLQNIKDEIIESRMETYYTKSRGISLFMPVPINRTCHAAGIDDHWCTCHRSRKFSTNSTVAQEASEFLVSYLNNLLEDQPQCARLEIKAVVEAMELITQENDRPKFMVVVETSPSGGLFEATLERYGLRWSPAGTISRLNSYGEQSRCVQVAHLKLYCYCQ